MDVCNGAFVVDASMALAWIHPSQATTESDAWLAALASEADLVVPGIWPLEVANALLALERRRKLTPGEREQALIALSALPVTLQDPDHHRVFSEVTKLAREEGLSVYDACYLDLALERAVPLACKDGALRKAASRRGVRVAP